MSPQTPTSEAGSINTRAPDQPALSTRWSIIHHVPTVHRSASPTLNQVYYIGD